MKYVLPDLFGRNHSSKVVFDARRPPEEILMNSETYSYVHNFKVHYKASKIQTKNSKVDISVISSSSHIPILEEVELQFNQRMMLDADTPKLWNRYEIVPSYHVTKVEYRGSLGVKHDVPLNSVHV